MLKPKQPYSPQDDKWQEGSLACVRNFQRINESSRACAKRASQPARPVRMQAHTNMARRPMRTIVPTCKAYRPRLQDKLHERRPIQPNARLARSWASRAHIKPEPNAQVQSAGPFRATHVILSARPAQITRPATRLALHLLECFSDPTSTFSHVLINFPACLTWKIHGIISSLLNIFYTYFNVN